MTKKHLKSCKKIINLRFFNLKKSFLKIDFSFFVLFLIYVFIGEWLYFFTYIVFLFLHEMIHFFVAEKFGYYPKRIKLNYFGAVLEGLDDFNFKDELKIVLAGPIFNLFVVILCYLSFWFNPETYDFFRIILNVNLTIFFFNMIPVFPLDCGRLILAFLSIRKNRLDALKLTRKISFTFLVLSLAFSVFSIFVFQNYSFSFCMINLIFLFFSSQKNTSFKREFFIEKKLKKIDNGLIERTIYVDINVNLFSLFKFIDCSHFSKFVFLNKNGEVCSTMTEIEFYKKIRT